MPCILCHRYIAALPLAICQRCKDARRVRELMLRAAEAVGEGTRIDRRPPYRPARRNEQPETD